MTTRLTCGAWLAVREEGDGAGLGCWAKASWAAGKVGAGLQADFPGRGEGFLFFFFFSFLFFISKPIQKQFENHFKNSLAYLEL
jgi:hypothetical protein